MDIKKLSRTGSVANYLIIIAALVLGACSDSNNAQLERVNSESVAIIAGVASDYSSSEIAVAEASAPFDLVEGYAQQALSDISVTANGRYFYRIGKYNQDNLTKYDLENPSLVQWQFSTDDPGATAPSNPYDVLFVSSTKAYLIRYGAATVWIINPSVSSSNEAGFKIGEIDLSAYDADGVPQMSAAAIHNGRLYVAMQVMDGSFVPGNAYLAVIDIASDTEIDVSAGSLDGIALGAKNPADMAVIGNHLYIASVGRYERWWIPADPEFTGGLVKVNLTTNVAELLIDDGDATSAPYGNIGAVALVSETKGYIKGTQATGSSNSEAKLFPFHPGTGIVGAEIGAFSGLDIQSIAVSPEGLLWVGIGDASNPEIAVLDPASDTVVDTIAVSTNPRKIVFTSYSADD